MNYICVVFFFFFALSKCHIIMYNIFAMLVSMYMAGGIRRGPDRMVVGFITTFYLPNQCLSPLKL